MPPTCQAVIVNVGLTTPLGLCARQTAAEVACGSSAAAESTYLDERGEPLVMMLVPDQYLPPLAGALAQARRSPREARLIRLAGTALAEVLAPVADGHPSIPWTVALPEHADPGRAIDQIAIRHAIPIQAGSAGRVVGDTVVSGRAGGLAAIRRAAADIEAGACDAALVLGVDTYDSPGLLARLERQ